MHTEWQEESDGERYPFLRSFSVHGIILQQLFAWINNFGFTLTILHDFAAEEHTNGQKAMMILVGGMQTSEQNTRCFTQTFMLVKQGNVWKIGSDRFRFMDWFPIISQFIDCHSCLWFYGLLIFLIHSWSERSKGGWGSMQTSEQNTRCFTQTFMLVKQNRATFGKLARIGFDLWIDCPISEPDLNSL